MFDANAFLQHLSQQPGVYRMFNADNEVIYVGKAKNLKKRVSSYFREHLDHAKTRALVSQIANIEVTVVNTETEAFLLENTLIKKYRPRYNVVMRDDKSYPYIHLSEHRHPRLGFHRGAKKDGGDYFGPYPSSWSVRESLRTIQRLFPIRQCDDTEYRSRSRPCLQYQLKRCSAPCVAGHIEDSDYLEQVALLKLFLSGKNQEVITRLIAKMDSASQALQFERAARYRDQISALRRVREQQFVAGTQEEMDVFGYARQAGAVCIQVLFIRDHQLLGNKAFFPKVPSEEDDQAIFESFLLQFYLAGNKAIPRHIVIPMSLTESDAITEVLSTQAGRKVSFYLGVREEKRQYLSLAQKNAVHSLEAHVGNSKTVLTRFIELERYLELDKPVQRIECFDISHTAGEQTVASCVVFNREGPLKSDYRRYHIEGITPGDDYAAMAQALQRRFKSGPDAGNIPDVLLIDGGKGQLAQAEQFFEPWPASAIPCLIGVAKGTSRKPGLETLILAGAHATVDIPPHSPGLHLVQHVRDEAHRFAIAGHRAARQKVKTTSSLQNIPGVGAKKRQALLLHLGGLQGLKKASKADIARVPGIGEQLAEVVYAHLHSY